MTQITEVERIHIELEALKLIILKADSPSDLIAFEAISAKMLLLSAASYFERQICLGIENTARAGGAREPFIAFISIQGLNRKYHAMFDWKKNNVNKFLGLFGVNFRQSAEQSINQDDLLLKGMRDFLYIGDQRNQMAHENFASFALGSNLKDVWEKYVSAKLFSDWLPIKLAEYSIGLPTGDDGQTDES